LKLPEKDSKKEEKPPADAGKDAETEKKDTGPKIPYAEGTDKYKAAKALLAG
jgi:hypothetical protein